MDLALLILRVSIDSLFSANICTRLTIAFLSITEFMEVMTGDLDDSSGSSWRPFDCPPKRALYRFLAP